MTDRQLFNQAFEQAISDSKNKATYNFTNQHGITSEISINITNVPRVGLGIKLTGKLTGKFFNVEKFENVLAVDSNDLFKHYDDMLRATICTVALEDLRPENF